MIRSRLHYAALFLACLIAVISGSKVAWAESIGHSHTGSASEGGGCYKTEVLCGGKIEEYKVEHDCGSLTLATYAYTDNAYIGNEPGNSPNGACPSCGSNYYRKWDYGYSHMKLDGSGPCNLTHVGTFYICKNCGYKTMSVPCGYSGGAIQYNYVYCSDKYYTKAYHCSICKKDYTESDYRSGKTCSVLTGYATNCGHTEGETLLTAGTSVDVTKPTNGDVMLTLDFTGDDAVLKSMSVKWQDGSSEKSFLAKENGTYEALVTVKDGELSKSLKMSYTVSNIDKIAPTVTFTAPEDLSKWYEGEIVLTAYAGDEGLGLADKPYSFDGGQTYVAESTYAVSESGTYTVTVCDKAGNTSTASVSVKKAIKPTPTPSPTPAAVTAQTPATVPTQSTGGGQSQTGGNAGTGESQSGGNGQLVAAATPSVSPSPESIYPPPSPSIEPDHVSSASATGDKLSGKTSSKKEKEKALAEEPKEPKELSEEAGDATEELLPTDTSDELLWSDGEEIPYYDETEGKEVALWYAEDTSEDSGNFSSDLVMAGALAESKAPLSLFGNLSYSVRMILFGISIAVILLMAWLLKGMLDNMIGVRMKGDDGEYHYIAHVRAKNHRGNLQTYLKPALCEAIDKSQVRLRFSENFMRKNKGREILILWQDGQQTLSVQRDAILHLD